MSKHTLKELQQKQMLPLKAKIRLTEERIIEWVQTYGMDGVFVSFSGGKDSTVLLDISRKLYPDIQGVFIDTGLEYPELRKFVKTFDNIEWIKPKLTFKQVVDKYGYPLISKEVSNAVFDARRYLDGLIKCDSANPGGYENDWKTFLSYYGEENVPQILLKISNINKAIDNIAVQKMLGIFRTDGLSTIETLPMHKEELSNYVFRKYAFCLDAPFEISGNCCDVMKKNPSHSYSKMTGRNPITAQMASESRLRTSNWIRHGCNGFDLKLPVSNPMAFWTNQDVLLYIAIHELEIASVYGDIVIDGYNTIDEDADEQWLFDPYRPQLKTTGCERTGCMFCGFGCHLEDDVGRFERLKETHPQTYNYIMRPDGLNYKFMIDWMNEHGNLKIKY